MLSSVLQVLPFLPWALITCIAFGHAGGCNEKTIEPAEMPLPASTSTSTPAVAVRTLLVRGQFELDGTALRKTYPLRIVSRKASSQHRSETGPFALYLKYIDGEEVRVRFDATIADDSDPGQTFFGSFTVEVELLDTALVRVEIKDAQGDQSFMVWDGDEIAG